MALFGFTEAAERDLFRILIAVSGVGPKVALAMLATMNASQLHHAVMSEDVDALTMVPGIGKRSAQKLILELRPKLDMPDTDLLPTGSVLGEVRSALEALGYQNTEIREVTKDLPVEGSVEDLLRSALQTLGQGNR
jgi:Holliday junction DNA helicase RuvA